MYKLVYFICIKLDSHATPGVLGEHFVWLSICHVIRTYIFVSIKVICCFTQLLVDASSIFKFWFYLSMTLVLKIQF